jgi:hypothetical protein
LRYYRSRFFTFLFFMPKISRNILGEYNKSCSAPHQESRKIEFAIFRILRFSREFTRFSKLDILLKLHFCSGTPKTSQNLTDIAFPCTQALGKIPILTSVPSRRGVGSPAVKICQPSHEFTFGVGITFVSYPLVLTPVV